MEPPEASDPARESRIERAWALNRLLRALNAVFVILVLLALVIAPSLGEGGRPVIFTLLGLLGLSFLARVAVVGWYFARRDLAWLIPAALLCVGLCVAVGYTQGGMRAGCLALAAVLSYLILSRVGKYEPGAGGFD